MARRMAPTKTSAASSVQHPGPYGCRPEQISSAPVKDEQAPFAGTEDDESDAGLSSLPTVQHIGSCWGGPVWGPAGDAVATGSKVQRRTVQVKNIDGIVREAGSSNHSSSTRR